MLKAEVLFVGKTKAEQRNALTKGFQSNNTLSTNWHEAKNAITTIGFDSSQKVIAQKRRDYGCSVVVFFKGKSHVIENCKNSINANKKEGHQILFIEIETETAGYKKVDGVYHFDDTTGAVKFLKTAPPNVLRPEPVALSQKNEAA